MKVGLPLLENVLTPLAKRAMIPLRLTAAASVQIRLLKRKFMDQV